MADKRNARRGGFYFHQKTPYVSVTNVLKIIDKPALRYWFGREVYWAMINNPDMGEKEALSAPWKTSGKAKSRGSTVHSIIESYKHTGDIITDTPEEFKGYAKAFERFVREYDIKVLEHEKTVLNHEYKYAGTLDMLIEVNTRAGSKLAILDAKTGKDIYPESALQLSAYKHANLGVDVDRIGVILLQDDGNYKFAWQEDQFDAFLAAQQLWVWANKDTCDKVNYKI